LKKIVKYLGLIGAFVAMASCTTMQPLSTDHAQVQKEVQAGDEVNVSRTVGQPIQFKVVKIDDLGLHGAGVDVPYDDIKSVNREEISWWKTGFLGATVTAVAVLIASTLGKTTKSGSAPSGGGW